MPGASHVAPFQPSPIESYSSSEHSRWAAIEWLCPNPREWEGPLPKFAPQHPRAIVDRLEDESERMREVAARCKKLRRLSVEDCVLLSERAFFVLAGIDDDGGAVGADGAHHKHGHKHKHKHKHGHNHGEGGRLEPGAGS